MSVMRPIRRSVGRLVERVAGLFAVVCDTRSARYLRLEARVPAYVLPDPLVLLDGTRVEEAKVWAGRRRAEILKLFETHVYGQAPVPPAVTPWRVLSVDDQALAGLATRKEVQVSLVGDRDGPSLPLLLYLPNQILRQRKKAPVFLGLNFFGNHTVHRDAGISIPQAWIPNNSVTQGRPPESLRGLQASSWQLEYILSQGYGLATAYCGSVVPDRADREPDLHKWYRECQPNASALYAWGAIGGWAWGLSRAMDYLVEDSDVDSKRVAVMGHSRLGKTALWAGAQDKRFAIVVSNNSGCGGAALSRRRFGETAAMINDSFPHWFCEDFKRYSHNENALPVDQHELLGLVAPRPVYVASAWADLDADPMGEFLAAKHAGPVYRLLGASGLPVEKLPRTGVPARGTIGYHLRRGAHGIRLFDWKQFIAFTEMHFGNRSLAQS